MEQYPRRRRRGARKDAEGLQTMRTLAKNMSWLLKSIEAGKANGVTFPVVMECELAEVHETGHDIFG